MFVWLWLVCFGGRSYGGLVGVLGLCGLVVGEGLGKVFVVGCVVWFFGGCNVRSVEVCGFVRVGSGVGGLQGFVFVLRTGDRVDCELGVMFAGGWWCQVF